jgi:hypothetical protein
VGRDQGRGGAHHRAQPTARFLGGFARRALFGGWSGCGSCDGRSGDGRRNRLQARRRFRVARPKRHDLSLERGDQPCDGGVEPAPPANGAGMAVAVAADERDQVDVGECC